MGSQNISLKKESEMETSKRQGEIAEMSNSTQVESRNVEKALYQSAQSAAMATSVNEATVTFFARDLRVELNRDTATSTFSRSISLSIEDYNSLATTWNLVKNRAKSELDLRMGHIISQDVVPLQQAKQDIVLIIQTYRLAHSPDVGYQLRAFPLNSLGFMDVNMTMSQKEEQMAKYSTHMHNDESRGIITAFAKQMTMKNADDGFHLYPVDVFGIWTLPQR